jgi:hypothetical protein
VVASRTPPSDPRAGLGSGGGVNPRRRRRGFRVPVAFLVVLAIGGWFAWAQFAAGGASKEVHSAIDKARGMVEHATTDPSLKRAATYFNAQYARDGHYTNLTESEQRDDPDADWGVGVTVVECSPQAMVLQSLTGAGSVSRLLVAGKDYGDVLGEPPCPIDLTKPTPWTVPNA